MKTEIDMKTYKKRNQYHWFSTFPDPTYGFNVEIDVTDLVHLSKSRKESFFPYFLYAIIKGINDIPEMRMREEKGHVYLYDMVHPTFTVMTEEGVYQNCGFPFIDDFPSFYKRTKEVIQKVKSMPVSDDLDRFPICKEPNVIYATCIPFLDYSSMSHPTPANNHDSLSVPRVCFDQYALDKEENYHCTLNITVSHTLVDGFPLGRCFEAIQNYCRQAETTFKE